MGGEGAPSPWSGPISVLRDMGGTAEAGPKPAPTQWSEAGASSSDDEAITFCIKRQQGERREHIVHNLTRWLSNFWCSGVMVQS